MQVIIMKDMMTTLQYDYEDSSEAAVIDWDARPLLLIHLYLVVKIIQNHL